MAERLDEIIQLIANELSNIDSTKSPRGSTVKYNNTIRHVEQFYREPETENDLPMLCVTSPAEEIEPESDDYKVVSEFVDVYVIGYYTGEHTYEGSRQVSPAELVGRSIRQDLKRCIMGFATWYAHSTTPDGEAVTNRWQVDFGDENLILESGVDAGETVGWIGAKFTVRVWAVNSETM